MEEETIVKICNMVRQILLEPETVEELATQGKVEFTLTLLRKRQKDA